MSQGNDSESQSGDSESQSDADGGVARLSKALNLENCEDRFMSSDLSLLETGNFSDVEMFCGNRSWSLHKSVICKRCKWFEKALTGGFEEATTNKITITEFSPELVDVVVRYLYSGAIDTKEVGKCEGDSIISKYVRLWSAADFFLLESLQKDVIGAIEDYLERCIKIMNQAKPAQKTACVVEQFFSAVATAYDVCPHAKTCQRVLTDFAHAVRFRLYKSRTFVDLIPKFPGLASDLFLIAVTGNSSKWVGDSEADYSHYYIQDECMGCESDSSKAKFQHLNPAKEADDPSFSDVPWKCEKCVAKSGYPWERYATSEDEE